MCDIIQYANNNQSMLCNFRKYKHFKFSESVKFRI